MIAIFLLATSNRLNSAIFTAREINALTLSLCGNMALDVLASPCLPAYTVGIVAPSSSGRATSIVVSIGPNPVDETSH